MILKLLYFDLAFSFSKRFILIFLKGLSFTRNLIEERQHTDGLRIDHIFFKLERCIQMQQD